MSSTDRGQYPESERDRNEPESLADQALEAIVRSQQTRERSRRLREKMGSSSAEESSHDDN